MSYVFPPPPVVSVPIADRDNSFPVHRIYCVGRNYGDHVKEMGGDPRKEPPVFFSKPASAIVTGNQDVSYPPATNELHHEVELVVALRSGGHQISTDRALDCVFGYAVGVDFTRRDLQAEAKRDGKPWDLAKGFDQSAPVSAIQPREGLAPPSAAITLSVDGELKQDGMLTDMIWSVPEIISELSNYFELRAGDLIFTGTPAGVSAVSRGHRIEAAIADIGSIQFQVL
ncbi:MAG: fumarylacetoacetate hydrolase family protein [Gammaproteobacteria bacterium]